MANRIKSAEIRPIWRLEEATSLKWYNFTVHIVPNKAVRVLWTCMNDRFVNNVAVNLNKDVYLSITKSLHWQLRQLVTTSMYSFDFMKADVKSGQREA